MSDARVPSGGSPLRRFRIAHERELIRVLRVRGPLTRQELIDETGLSRTTLYAIIGELLEAGAIVESPSREAPRRGRPVSVISLDPRSSSVVGVEIGRTHIGVVVANLAHEVIASVSQAFELERTADEIARGAIDAVHDAFTENGLSFGRLDAIVIGIPLFFGGTSEGGEELQADLGERIGRAFGVQPVFENNARLVALAEMQFGSAAGVDDLLYVHLDEGVGGGIVLGRRLIVGPHGRAGELGHVSVSAEGPVCWCGGRGCLERYLALSELSERTGFPIADLLGAPDLADRIDEQIGLLARVIAGQLSALDLRVVVLGGVLGNVDGVAARVADHLASIVPAYIRESVEVRAASLGALGSARGGIVLSLAEGVSAVTD